MKRTSLIAVCVAAVAVLATIWLILDRPVEPLAPTIPPLASAESPPLSATVTPAPSRPEIVFTRLQIDTSSAQPEACLSFSGRLAAENVRYEDYLRLSPRQQFNVAVRGDRLCIAGLAFGRQYDLELLEVLPGEKDTALRRGEKMTVSLGDRPALVSFTGGTILPRESSGGVPISTINVGA